MKTPTKLSSNWAVSRIAVVAVTLRWFLPSMISTSPKSSILFASAMEAELEFNYLPIGHVRTDPIISDSCLSDHVHTFYGPPLMSPSVTTDDLLATNPSEHSGLVKENKSLYWHPSIYRVSSEGIFTLDEIHYASFYYFWDPENSNTKAFPKGFRMIASDREAFTECVVNNFRPCSRSDGCDIPEGVTTFFPSQACDMLEITMDFPSCWDGRIDSPNHKDHMAYPNEDDECVAPNNLQVPTLSISIYIKDYDGGYHTWSDLSDRFHTDYLSGWDVNLMEQFLVGCRDDVDHCDRFLTWKGNGEATGCDSHDEKHAKLVAIQPPLPNTRETIASEAVTNIASLPRGMCQGDVIAPTNAPEPTPKPTSSSCTNDDTFRFRNKKRLTCRWVGKQPNRRCRLKWKQKALREYCPESCGVCHNEEEEDGETCLDNPSFRFRNKAKNDCAWVGQRMAQRCGYKWKQKPIGTHWCQQTCDECNDA